MSQPFETAHETAHESADESVDESTPVSLQGEVSPEVSYSPVEIEALKGHIIEAMRQVYDPELPLNIYDLGLIYEVKISERGVTHVLMTLTNPACPVAGTLPKEVEEAVKKVKGLSSVKVELTWTPAWSKDRLSPEHQLLFSTFM